MRAVGHDHNGHARGTPVAFIVLAHDERVLRRKRLPLADGKEVLVDLPHAVDFGAGDVLVLEDGGVIEIIAADEALYEIRARDPGHLARLVWHIGNRHLACQIDMDASRLLVARDPVIGAMLEGLGATVHEIEGPFTPVRGAYAGHGDVDQDNESGNDHDHERAPAGHLHV